MTAFSEFYKLKVEANLNRKLTKQECTVAHLKYIKNWHPKRTAQFLQYTSNTIDKDKSENDE